MFIIGIGGVWFSGLVGLDMSADGAIIEAPREGVSPSPVWRGNMLLLENI